MLTYVEPKVQKFLYDGQGVRVYSGDLIMKVSPSQTEEWQFNVHVKCKDYEIEYTTTLYDVYMSVNSATPPFCNIEVINVAHYCSLKLHNQMAVAGFGGDYQVYRSASGVFSTIESMLYDFDRLGKLGAYTVEERIAMAEKTKAAGLW